MKIIILFKFHYSDLLIIEIHGAKSLKNRTDRTLI